MAAESRNDFLLHKDLTANGAMAAFRQTGSKTTGSNCSIGFRGMLRGRDLNRRYGQKFDSRNVQILLRLSTHGEGNDIFALLQRQVCNGNSRSGIGMPASSCKLAFLKHHAVRFTVQQNRSNRLVISKGRVRGTANTDHKCYFGSFGYRNGGSEGCTLGFLIECTVFVGNLADNAAVSVSSAVHNSTLTISKGIIVSSRERISLCILCNIDRKGLAAIGIGPNGNKALFYQFIAVGFGNCRDLNCFIVSAVFTVCTDHAGSIVSRSSGDRPATVLMAVVCNFTAVLESCITSQVNIVKVQTSCVLAQNNNILALLQIDRRHLELGPTIILRDTGIGGAGNDRNRIIIVAGDAVNCDVEQVRCLVLVAQAQAIAKNSLGVLGRIDIEGQTAVICLLNVPHVGITTGIITLFKCLFQSNAHIRAVSCQISTFCLKLHSTAGFALRAVPLMTAEGSNLSPHLQFLVTYRAVGACSITRHNTGRSNSRIGHLCMLGRRQFYGNRRHKLNARNIQILRCICSHSKGDDIFARLELQGRYSNRSGVFCRPAAGCKGAVVQNHTFCAAIQNHRGYSLIHVKGNAIFTAEPDDECHRGFFSHSNRGRKGCALGIFKECTVLVAILCRTATAIGNCTLTIAERIIVSNSKRIGCGFFI